MLLVVLEGNRELADNAVAAVVVVMLVIPVVETQYLNRDYRNMLRSYRSEHKYIYIMIPTQVM